MLIFSKNTDSGVKPWQNVLTAVIPNVISVKQKQKKEGKPTAVNVIVKTS